MLFSQDNTISPGLVGLSQSLCFVPQQIVQIIGGQNQEFYLTVWGQSNPVLFSLARRGTYSLSALVSEKISST